MQKEIWKKMSLRDQIALCSGADFWHTKEMRQYRIPAVMMADGPHGLRIQKQDTDMLGVHRSAPATCFPTAALTACSWDEGLLDEIGAAIGEEAAAAGVGVVLGPGANIKRNPLCGRNFEYFSEDPHLTGKLAAAMIRGIERAGAAACLKHFALNNQEYKRFSSDSVADERTMREIYLSGFETAVREGAPSALMCAYNKVNGIFCSDHRQLLTDILRKEWGFAGTVITDWGAMGDRISAFAAGCDLCMPGGSAYMEREALQAAESDGALRADIAASVQRVLRLIERAGGGKRKTQADMEAHHRLACRAAEESAVLLKNEDGLLPLAPGGDVAFLGYMAKEMRFQGSGSSHVNPHRLVHPLEVCVEVPFAPGYGREGGADEALLREAAGLAESVQTAVVFAGLPDACESEGFDREDAALPEGHRRLIERVAAANPNTVVVLFAGGVVEMPWADRVKSILYMGLPGEAGGEAVQNLLYGRAVPCGKLAESWFYRYGDCVCSEYWGKGRDAHYREGLYVGYRYYGSAGVPVRFPFGYGLSYTTFAYSDPEYTGSAARCRVRNTGAVAAKEIVQMYLEPPDGPFYRPKLELKGFCKIELAPGEEKAVTLPLTKRSFAVWDGGWTVPPGTYRIRIGADAQRLPLSLEVEKKGEGPAMGQKTGRPAPAWYAAPHGKPSQHEFEELLGRPAEEEPVRKGAFTMEHSIADMRGESLLMRLLYRAIRTVLVLKFGRGGGKNRAQYRMLLSSASDASLRAMRINAGMKRHIMEGLLEIANGRWFRGIRMFFVTEGGKDA